MSNVAHPFLSITPPKRTSSCLGKHNITSKQWKNRNKLWDESAWDPLKVLCDIKKTTVLLSFTTRSHSWLVNLKVIGFVCMGLIVFSFHFSSQLWFKATSAGLLCVRNIQYEDFLWGQVLSHPLLTSVTASQDVLICTYHMSKLMLLVQHHCRQHCTNWSCNYPLFLCKKTKTIFLLSFSSFKNLLTDQSSVNKWNVAALEPQKIVWLVQ